MKAQINNSIIGIKSELVFITKSNVGSYKIICENGIFYSGRNKQLIGLPNGTFLELTKLIFSHGPDELFSYIVIDNRYDLVYGGIKTVEYFISIE